MNASAATETAVFAGGCFWCIEAAFEELDGVIEVTSGYTGGDAVSPTYEQVCSGSTGHYEAVRIVFDPEKISYADLLKVFWMQIDPTDAGGQFADRGTQYRTAVFYNSDSQKESAERSKRFLEEAGLFNKPIVTQILPADKFYPAEDYHQDYSRTCPLKYKAYKKGSGREDFIKKAWTGFDFAVPDDTVPSQDEIKSRLTPKQYEVTQLCATERPFDNEYWDNKSEGIYVDIVSGEPLFSSSDKFDSGTGWPSFTKPISGENIVEKEDNSMPVKRTEVRSRKANSHLGHLFEDGPAPSGMRYCINSAALRFIPKKDLEKEGYGKYKNLFDE